MRNRNLSCFTTRYNALICLLKLRSFQIPLFRLCEHYNGQLFAPTQNASDIVWTPLRYVTLHFGYRRNATSFRYRNRAEITVLISKQKPFDMVSYWSKSYPVQHEHSLALLHCPLNTCHYILRERDIVWVVNHWSVSWFWELFLLLRSLLMLSRIARFLTPYQRLTLLTP